ncbi:hypothetical protein Tsubulata_031904 [Turnera subulata]|uniref:DUF4378 domain-containing protein n=1 Tax=Turnera subulata TaxID=218843 RepID=A0A9Q0FS70_9ROSI|nr:hypothetical protein Tsubulata_031904 [Turnera subulata]
MGKEWSRGGAKSSKKGGGGGRREGDNATAPGCMCSMFQIFDFYQFPFTNLHQQQPSSAQTTNSFLPDEQLPPIPKGSEAPRNSLELEEPSLPVNIHEDDTLNIPIGIHIKTKGNTRLTVHGAANDSSSSSDISSSPATKTPTLVARLMGLDLLPDQSSSPRLSSSSTLGTPHHEATKSHLLHHPLRSQQYPLQTKLTGHRRSLDSDTRSTRSLPETPRISSARRSDVEHRLSLQINKENMSTSSEEMGLSRFSSLKRKQPKAEEESRSPGHYARQIVKQVKESVSRKVGLDITNTAVRNREQGRRDQELLVSQLKSKKLSQAMSSRAINNADVSSSGKHYSLSTSSSSSPRLKSLDQKSKPPITSTVNPVLFNKDHDISRPQKQPLLTSLQVNILSSQTTKDSSFYNKPSLEPVQEYDHHHQHQYHHRQRQTKKCKKVTEERFGPPPPRLKKLPQTPNVIRKKQEEPFVRPTTPPRANINPHDKKCKKTPLSNELLHNISTVPTLLPVKKDPTPPATKLPQSNNIKVLADAQESKRGSQLSSCSSQSYKTDKLHSRDNWDNKNNINNNHHPRDRSNGAAAAATAPCTATAGGPGGVEYHEYVTRILRRTGIDKDTPVSCTSWFSPSHPLDPSIFYLLEPLATGEKYGVGHQLGHRCNRKLLFHLVDEVLVDILRPFIKMRPWVGSSIMGQSYFISGHMKGSHLIEMLCSRIRDFPCSSCQVLEDIDALIDKDLPDLWVENEAAFEEEGEGIVMEIEKDIIDTLVQEAALALYEDYNHRDIKMRHLSLGLGLL